MVDSQINIIINTMKKGLGDKDTKAALKDIGKDFQRTTGLSLSYAGALSATIAVAKKFIDITNQSVQKTAELATKQDDIARLTGNSAEQSGRLLQMTDDLFISYDKLSGILSGAAKKGTDTHIESIKALSEEYLKLNTNEEKNKFLIEQFGKTGLDFKKVMELGAEGIQKKMDAVSASLVLDQKAIAQMIAYKKSVDDVNDAQEALIISIGRESTPAVTEFNNQLADTTQRITDSKIISGLWAGVLYTVRGALAGVDVLLGGNIEKLEAGGSTMVDWTWAQQMGYMATTDLNSALLTESDKLAAVKAGLSGELQSALETYQTTMSGLNGTVEENNQKQLAAEEQLKRTTAQFIYQQIAAKLDSDSSLELARSMGLIDEQSYEVSKSTLGVIAKFDLDKNGKIEGSEANKEFYASMQLIYNQQLLTLGLQDKTFKYTIQTYYQTFGNPGALNYNPDTGQLDGGPAVPSSSGSSDSGHAGEAHNNGQNGYYDNSGKWHWWAAGGNIFVGQSGFTGEKGIEYISSASDGYIIPHDDLVQIGKMFGNGGGGGGGGPVIIQNHFEINGATDARAVAVEVKNILERQIKLQVPR